MKIFKNFNIKKKYKNSVIAIGNFDGVHLGHKKTLQNAKKKAKKNKINFGVLTFEPLPVMFFNKKIKNHRINSLSQKIENLKKEKVDFLVIKKFDKKFSKINYIKFIKDVIFKKFESRYIFVSKNFRFGKNREGNVNKLIEFEKKFNYKTVVTKIFKKKNKVVSSTKIRNMIKLGKVDRASSFLGKFWCIRSIVIKGFKRGRLIGFPTCNMKIHNYTIPKLGVYSVKVENRSFSKNGIANVGYRPTFNGKNILLEVNIFGINKNLYKKELSIHFKKFLRNEKKFKNINELKKQIKIDITKAKFI